MQVDHSWAQKQISIELHNRALSFQLPPASNKGPSLLWPVIPLTPHLTLILTTLSVMMTLRAQPRNGKGVNRNLNKTLQDALWAPAAK